MRKRWAGVGVVASLAIVPLVRSGASPSKGGTLGGAPGGVHPRLTPKSRTTR